VGEDTKEILVDYMTNLSDGFNVFEYYVPIYRVEEGDDGSRLFSHNAEDIGYPIGKILDPQTILVPCFLFDPMISSINTYDNIRIILGKVVVGLNGSI
jgi:hypothetical protein